MGILNGFYSKMNPQLIKTDPNILKKYYVQMQMKN